jgi:hypothetical protein
MIASLNICCQYETSIPDRPGWGACRFAWQKFMKSLTLPVEVDKNQVIAMWIRFTIKTGSDTGSAGPAHLKESLCTRKF